MNCPACGTKGIRVVASGFLKSSKRKQGDPLGPCAACGWCAHTSDISDYTAATGLCEWCNRPAVAPRDMTAVEHLPKPRDMDAEEFGFRAGLYVLWKTRPASEFLSQLAIFADWLADRDSAEEVAARADWQPYGHKNTDPRGWWQWHVPVGKGWVTRHKEPGYDWIDYDKARITKSMHNGRWFLCWPPGFVRITAPLHWNCQRWRVGVQANRLVGKVNSRPVERVWPAGYTQLLCDHSAPRLGVRCGVLVPEDEAGTEDLGLFRESA